MSLRPGHHGVTSWTGVITPRLGVFMAIRGVQIADLMAVGIAIMLMGGAMRAMSRRFANLIDWCALRGCAGGTLSLLILARARPC